MAVRSTESTLASCFSTCLFSCQTLSAGHVFPVGFILPRLMCDIECRLQVVAAVAMSRTLQKGFKPLMNMSIAALEPQLDRCRCGMHPAQSAEFFMVSLT